MGQRTAAWPRLASVRGRLVLQGGLPAGEKTRHGHNGLGGWGAVPREVCTIYTTTASLLPKIGDRVPSFGPLGTQPFLGK